MRPTDVTSGLSWAEVDDLFWIDPEKGEVIWKNPQVFNANFLRGKPAGTFGHVLGYVMICIKRKSYKRHRLIWFYVHKRWPENDLDHIDGDNTNDKISNLREATRAQNMWNSIISKRNKSGTKGVSWSAQKGKWNAQLMVNGHLVRLGQFKLLDDAVNARKSAELVYHQGYRREGCQSKA